MFEVLPNFSIILRIVSLKTILKETLRKLQKLLKAQKAKKKVASSKSSRKL
jgi:hypothetical protein